MAAEGVGRLLVASLHQSIADILPLRLDFYEHWLNKNGLRDGTIGLASFLAVLSFLRQEGEVYQQVTTKAGQYAADWMIEAMPPMRRSMIRALPAWWQQRVVIGLVDRLARRSYTRSRAAWTIRRGVARICVGRSVFCSVREPAPYPLCTFYASACTRLLAIFGFETHADILSCRGTGESLCELSVQLVTPAGAATTEVRPV